MSTSFNRPVVLDFSTPMPRRGTRAAVTCLFAAAARLLLTWQTRARQRADLAAMSDRMLADIGISRIEAMQEASKPFWAE